ncbi:Beta-hexosaminidase A precursor [Piscirickettsia salmonis]|uniref:glycoside hydrolase family 3 N-terminal domain-containing protein n=1 Tax=Piscirickettsia salmonis TaxID=1238 RepID=UPI0012BA1922|nr:glycoside hydrolase family 3 N-terminal domain-containing protein [Piscirickettsia salmonis]QGP48647.1 Beta-hexosaminidase A precursor [Piscirickettsia salmonis]
MLILKSICKKYAYKLLFISALLITSYSLYAEQAKINTKTNKINIEEKIGQLFIVGFAGLEVRADSDIIKLIDKFNISGVYLADIDDEGYARNISGPEQLSQLVLFLQNYVKNKKKQKLFIAVEQEGGAMNSLHQLSGFNIGKNLSQQKLGFKEDSSVIYRQALHQGKELSRYGININFAPVLALSINRDSPVIARYERSYNFYANLVAKDAAAAVKGYQEANINCTFKNFPGLGSAEYTPGVNIPDISRTWSDKELMPYKLLINSGQFCPLVMVSHVINRKLDASGVPASLSKKMIKILRDRLKFRGAIISADMTRRDILLYAKGGEAAARALIAGNNLLLYIGHPPKQLLTLIPEVIYYLAAEAKKNPVLLTAINNSYLRIQRMKEAL